MRELAERKWHPVSL